MIDHLRLIQDIISRLSGQSADVKRWTMAAPALQAAALWQAAWSVALVALVIVVAFWYIDSRYLATERWYRELYEQVRTGKVTDYELPQPQVGWRAVWRSANSWSSRPFYGGLAVASIVIGFANLWGSGW